VKREDGSSYYKPSRKWKFFQTYLDELHRTKREQIKSALYAFSNQLVDDYDLIAIGNYTPHGGGISKGMRRSMNNQSQIGKFKRILSWVCQREGKLYFEWDERKSTKTCHYCGEETSQTQDPSVRAWKCARCNQNHLRDENAAINGFKPTLEWG
jgi:putative transposase